MKRMLILILFMPQFGFALDYNLDEDLLASNHWQLPNEQNKLSINQPVKSLQIESSVFKDNRWTWYDYAIEGLLMGLIYIDYRQTRHFLEQGTSYEKNKILGKYPSQSRLKNYIVLASLTHIGISYQIGKKYGKHARRFWLNGSLLKEYYTIDRNSEIGHTMNRVF